MRKKLSTIFSFFLIPFLVFSVYSITADLFYTKKTDQLQRLRPFQSHGHIYDENNIEAMRPRIMGIHGVVSTGHYLATQAGIEALKKGGNAFDAGVTAAMSLKVTKMGYAGEFQCESSRVQHGRIHPCYLPGHQPGHGGLS